MRQIEAGFRANMADISRRAGGKGLSGRSDTFAQMTSTAATALRLILLAAAFAPALASAGSLSNAYPLEIYQVAVAGFITPQSVATSTTTGAISVSYCFDHVACVYSTSEVETGANQFLFHSSSATGIGDDTVGGARPEIT